MMDDVRTDGLRPLEVRRLNDTEALRDVRSEWNELLQDSASNSLFLTWEWQHTWWKHLAGPRTLSVLTVRAGGRLVAIAPLAARTRWAAGVVPGRVLEFLGSEGLSSDYLDLIIRRGWAKPAVDALAQHFVLQPSLLELASLNPTTCVATDLAEALEHLGWRRSEEQVAVCPFITLAGHSWESYLATLGSEHRYNFHRRLRTLSKKFAVRFEAVRCEAERHEALVALITLHNLRRQDKGGSDAFNTPALLAFHEETSRVALALGWLRLFVLRLDGRPVAALYGFRYGRVFYFFQSGFDPAYGNHSVGLVTMGLAIKSALEEGADEYDLLRGDERYKYLWTKELRTLRTLTVCPRRPWERVYRRATAMTVAAKHTARRILPQPLLARITTYRQPRHANRLGVGQR